LSFKYLLNSLYFKELKVRTYNTCKMNQLKEYKRQVEIAAYVLENPDKYSEFELSEKFKIGTSTLHRDFRILREMNVDVRSRKKRIVIDISSKHLNSLLSTYISVCTQNNIRNLKQLRQKFKNKTISIFVDMFKAINEKRCLQMNYFYSESEGLINKIVEPLYLNPTRKSFYLIAFENGELRFFRLEGIETVRLTSTKFNRSIPLLSDIYKNSWGVYSGGPEIVAKLRFNKDKESYFKNRILAEEQEVKYVSGGILVELKVKLSFEFVSWVMGWGKEVKIVGPEELKEQVLLKARGLLDNNKK